MLSNTISVCEKYYIHPAVQETLSDGNFSSAGFHLNGKPEGLSYEGKITLAIIEKYEKEQTFLWHKRTFVPFKELAGCLIDACENLISCQLFII
jgi:hypothetical protein